MAQGRAADLPFKVELRAQAAERPVPIPTGTIDNVVLTWTLRTLDDPGLALSEIRRVMKRDGQLVFIEHASAPDPQVRRWQNRRTFSWKRFAGGCHLNRDVKPLLDRSGIQMLTCIEGYVPGPQPLMYTNRGVV